MRNNSGLSYGYCNFVSKIIGRVTNFSYFILNISLRRLTGHLEHTQAPPMIYSLSCGMLGKGGRKTVPSFSLLIRRFSQPCPDVGADEYLLPTYSQPQLVASSTSPSPSYLATAGYTQSGLCRKTGVDALVGFCQVVATTESTAVPFSTHRIKARRTSCSASLKPGTDQTSVPRAAAWEPPPNALIINSQWSVQYCPAQGTLACELTREHPQR